MEKIRICAMGMDDNGRSTTTFVDVPLLKVAENEFLSQRQDAVYWGLAFNQNSVLSNEYEMHLTNQPRIVGVMSGHAEITMQDGGTCRLASGEFIFVHGRALHHSTFRSSVPTQTLNVTFPGTADFKFK
jgi:hypothetical protein